MTNWNWYDYNHCVARLNLVHLPTGHLSLHILRQEDGVSRKMTTENKTDSNWSYSPIFYLSNNYHEHGFRSEQYLFIKQLSHILSCPHCTSMQDGGGERVPTAGRVLRQEPPCQGNRRQPETGTIQVIKLIDTCKLMKLLISSISFRTFQSFGPEPMMGSSWCGTTIGIHHCSRGSASTLLPRSFVAAFQTSEPTWPGTTLLLATCCVKGGHETTTPTLLPQTTRTPPTTSEVERDGR
jgi:hypothetical protein